MIVSFEFGCNLKINFTRPAMASMLKKGVLNTHVKTTNENPRTTVKRILRAGAPDNPKLFNQEMLTEVEREIS